MFDNKVINAFLDNQLQLFPSEVATTAEEANEFLEEVMATVVRGEAEVIEFFEEEGIDFEEEDILDAPEVFEIGDGRYLIVEA